MTKAAPGNATAETNGEATAGGDSRVSRPGADWHSVNDQMPPAEIRVVCVLDNDDELKGEFVGNVRRCGQGWVTLWLLEDGTTTNQVKAWRYL